MYRPGSSSGRLFGLLAFAATTLLPFSSVAKSVGILVPAYFYPLANSGWTEMTAAAAQVPVTAIVNPANGPGSTVDQNYFSAINALRTAGGDVVGYVYTNGGSRPLEAVESDVSKYAAFYNIDGFFIDEMTITSSTLSYYQKLEEYIKGLSPSFEIIGNPGIPQPHSLTAANYLSTADIFDIFEGPNVGSATSGFNYYPYGASWFERYPSARFSSIIYDVPASEMSAAVSRAVQLNAGNVYVTDNSGSNPYDELPSYWDQEISTLAALDAPSSAVPEPSTWTMMALALALLGIAGCRASWRDAELTR
jgi:hypothetical protein